MNEELIEQFTKALYANTQTASVVFVVGNRTFRKINKGPVNRVFYECSKNGNIKIGNYSPLWNLDEPHSWMIDFVKDAKFTEEEMTVYLVTDRIMKSEQPKESMLERFKRANRADMFTSGTIC